MTSAIQSGQFKEITSVLVARGGTLVYEAYYGGADVDTLHNTRSATKTITGMLIGIAIDQGLLAAPLDIDAAYTLDFVERFYGL